ncbi:MAG: sigma-54-dependent transcriptional regulator [Gemmataceae bacterium]
MPTLLVVDDEANVLYSLQTSLQTEELQVITATTARQGIDLVRTAQPDVVILDVRLPDMSGLDAFNQIRAIDPRLPVIIVTAFSKTETAIEAMRRGAYEYMLKPFDFRQLRAVVNKALEVSLLSRIPAVFDESEETDSAADRIIGQSTVMQEVYKTIGRVAPQDVTVLIQGESGTGKELIARAIYHYSRRGHMPFLAINCAAIPEALLESELFGHERGAFTGADRRRIGKFEQAHGGTIFLDEIGDMPPTTQAKILRLLQEQRFERLGSNEVIATDVRVIAATNKNLEELAAAGRFRADLMYRLNVLSIHLPPLRERMDDLPLLVNHFVKVLSRQLENSVRVVTPQVLKLLSNYSWPGNVRELQSAIKFAMVHAAGEVLTEDCLPEYLHVEADVESVSAMSLDKTAAVEEWSDVIHYIRDRLRQDGAQDLYRQIHSELDRVLFEEVLRHVRGSQLEAAALLGISRTTLRAKLRALGLAVEKQLLPESDHGDQFLSSH